MINCKKIKTAEIKEDKRIMTFANPTSGKVYLHSKILARENFKIGVVIHHHPLQFKATLILHSRIAVCFLIE